MDTNPLPANVSARSMRCFCPARPCMAAILILASLCPAKALALDAVVLPDSVKTVELAPAGGQIDPHKPAITRKLLTSAEAAAPIEIEVALKMRNFADLEARVARGELISPREMAAKYQPLAADYDAVATWISSQGLTITRRDPGHIALFARGTINQIQQALNVSFARVAIEGREYSSAITAPSVPANLSATLLGINGLQPHLRAHKHLIRRQAQPDATGGSASYYPSQLAQAYNVNGLYSANIRGSGQAIAIVIDTFPSPDDLVTFWKQAGVNQSLENIEFIQAVPGTLPAPSGEETLDVEWSSSMAPGARVRVYAATDLANADLDAAYQQVYSDVLNNPALGIHQMSMSYGEGEQYTTKAQVLIDDQYFAELGAMGVTVFASSGDGGSTPGPNGGENGPLQAESPASDPNVAGVGGTSLVLDTNNNISTETVWNDSSGASGGGVSEYFTRPGWQTGAGVGTSANREVPDIAASADPNFGAFIFQGGDAQTVGGTSWASPTCAGICALINQARADDGQGPIGVLGPHIYPALGTSAYSVYFHDITSGNNATRASAGNFIATTNYDLCTGLGSPHAQGLAQSLTVSPTLIGIQSPPALDEVTPGEQATFSVSVSGASPSYQWQVMPAGSTTWTNLTDSSTYAGTLTPTLTIANTTTDMSGNQYQCLVNFGAYTIITYPSSTLIVDNPLTISTLAGTPASPGLSNAGRGQFNYPSGVALDSFGNLYVADYGNNQIREITPGGTVSTPYGNINGFAGSGNGFGNNAQFNAPNAVAVDGSNNIYVADSGNNSIRKISGGMVSTLAGPGTGLDQPEGVAVDGFGNVYVADSGDDVIRKIAPSGTVSILAGQRGQPGHADGAALTTAEFDNPISVAVDNAGNVYVADLGNSDIRKISAGRVSTVAGQPDVSGYLDGTGTNTLFNAPVGLFCDPSNNLYITDSQVPPTGSNDAGNCLLRKMTPSGVVSTLAGEPGIAGSAVGTGTNAEFYSVQSVAENGAGQFFLADTYNQVIRSGSSGTTITSTTAIVSLSGELNFGNVEASSSATSILTINNIGNSTLNVTGISYPAGFSGDWSSGPVAAGGSQDVTVTFAPTADTSYGGNIVVSSDATGGSGSIAVSGTGVTVTIAPTVTTSAASDIGPASATLNCTVNPQGTITTVYFQYGTTTSYGSVTPAVEAGAGDTAVTISEEIGSLAPMTPYHYRAVALSGTNTVYGGDETFSTVGFSAAQAAATGDLAADITGAEFETFGNPAINGLDGLAFEATLANGPGGVAASDDAGVWAQDSTGTRHLVARSDESAPGAGKGVFFSFGNPVYNDNGQVAFSARLRIAAGEATATTALGIWSDSSGELSLVAQRGTQAPGYPVGVKFTAFTAFALPDQGGVILLGTVNTAADNTAIWEGATSANLHLVLKEGDTFNGSTITRLSFLPTVSYVNGQTRNFSPTSQTLLCVATFAGGGTGILKVTGGVFQSVALSQQSAPGVTGGEYSAFGNPILNSNGDVAFRATLVPGAGDVSAATDTGIWAGNNAGALQLITRTGDAAPGTAAIFRTLNDPVYNANEAVAFRGTLQVAANEAKTSTETGIWSDTGGSLALVARQGDQAPGCPAGATFSAFTSIALPDQGGVVFLGSLNANRTAKVTAANNAGIWAVDTGGVLELIVRKGDVVNGKVIKDLTFLPILASVGGQTRNFNQNTGDLVYEVTFADKSTAFYIVRFQ